MLQLNPTSLGTRTANSNALLLVVKIGLKKCAPRLAILEKCLKVLSGRQPENAPDARRFRRALSTYRSDTFPLENVFGNAQANQHSGIRRQGAGVRRHRVFSTPSQETFRPRRVRMVKNGDQNSTLVDLKST